MTLLLLVGVCAMLSATMMLAYVAQDRTRNAGWVDAIWTAGLGAAGAIYALAPIGAGSASRRWLVASLSLAWAARLGLHIVRRTLGGAEDARYAQFRRDWGTDFGRRMAIFLQIQAAAAAALAVPMLVAARRPGPLGWTDAAGVLLFVSGQAGAGIADAQLLRFRRDPANKGRVCDNGLWHWSRHPNYFFEWIGWLAWPALAIAPGYGAGWLALIGPVFMYVLLVHVSGIPPLEAQMARSRGEAWRAYVARTRIFVPLPRWRNS